MRADIQTRYLCAVEPDYFAKLSPDSVKSLALQGGRMFTAALVGIGQHARPLAP